jgi:hypothetical protein
MIGTHHATRKYRFQFGIGTLLFVIFCTGGFLAGYRGGYSVGQKARGRRDVHLRVYDVKDIVLASHDPGAGSTMVQYIRQTITPQTWDQKAGPGSLTFDSQRQSIVVLGSVDVQYQLGDFLEQCRRLQQQGKTRELDSILVSIQE